MSFACRMTKTPGLIRLIRLRLIRSYHASEGLLWCDMRGVILSQGVYIPFGELDKKKPATFGTRTMTQRLLLELEYA